MSALRGLVHGEPVGTEIGLVVAISAASVLVFEPLTMTMYRRQT